MKRLFLSSSFADVFRLFPDFAKTELKGKKVTFIPTASIPEKMIFYVASGKKALEKLGMTVDVLDISKTAGKVITSKLQDNDYIYVTGGNTFFLLQEMKRTCTDKIIADQIHSGKIYIGESAGSAVLSPDIEYVKEMDDYKKAPELNDLSALSIVNFYTVPHHSNFPFKKAVEKIIAQYGSKLKLVPISNSQVITVNGEQFEIRQK
jgi:dipeptidase E